MQLVLGTVRCIDNVVAICLTWARGRGTTTFGEAFFWLAVLWVHWALCTEEGSVSSAAYTCRSKWFVVDKPPPHAVNRKMTSYRFRSSSDENTMLVVRNRGWAFFVQGTYIVRVPINYPFWWNVKRFWTCAKRTDLAFIIRIFGAIVIVHLSWNLCIAMTLVALKLFAFVFLSAVQLRATFQNCQDSQCIKGCRSGSTTLVAGMIRFYPGAIVASAFGKDIVSAMELYLANLSKTFL